MYNNLFSFLSDGTPQTQAPSQIRKSLQAVAASTLDARHPGPRADPQDPLSRIVAETVNSRVRSPSTRQPMEEVTPRVETVVEQRPEPTSQQTLVIRDDGAELMNIEQYVPEAKHVYQCTCDHCDWVGMVSDDPTAVPGLVQQWEVHLKYNHDITQCNSSNKGSSNTAPENEEFKRATTPKDIPAHRDDRNRCLSSVRFLPSGLCWKNTARAVPVAHSDMSVCSMIDLSPTGVPAYNSKTITNCYRRDARDLRLQDFSDENLRTLKNDGFQRNADKSFKQIGTLEEGVRAAYNFLVIWGNIHPGDVYPKALFNVILDKYLSKTIPDATTLIRFFSQIANENANRAAKGELPTIFDEINSKWEHMVRQSSLAPPAAPVAHQRNNFSSYARNYGSNFSQYNNGTEPSFQSVGPFATPPPGAGFKTSTVPAAKKPRYKRNWCKKYNEPSGCSNPPSAEGCIGPDGGLLWHGCNARVAPSGRACNSKAHTALNHV